jgi:heme/copper-type cytochrome/quinol oxidase subunit 1
LSIAVRAEQLGLTDQALFGDHQFYNVLFSYHAILMIFFFVMPSILGGFANLRLPQLLGVPELVFPRLNSQAL